MSFCLLDLETDSSEKFRRSAQGPISDELTPNEFHHVISINVRV